MGDVGDQVGHRSLHLGHLPDERCRARGLGEPDVQALLKEYKGREIAQTMHYLGAPWLTRESRDREEDCKTLLAALKLKPGDPYARSYRAAMLSLKADLDSKQNKAAAKELYEETLKLRKAELGPHQLIAQNPMFQR